MTHPSPATLDVSAFSDDTVDLFGLKASDLQENASITDETMSGTLKNIPTDNEFYTTAGFDSSLGTNFLVVKATPSVESNKVQFSFNGTTKNLDPDGILVLQMTNEKKSLSVVFTEKNGSTTVSTYTLKLTGLTLAE